ncbi:MAG TPA: zinc ribbon domain-containing protein [Candidatus Acidoferrales bacterium]
MANFCTKCGAAVSGPFCGACGAPAQEVAAPGQSATPAAAPVSLAAAAAPAVRKGSGLKIVLIVLGVLMLFGAMGVGGLVYVGYRAKQKIAQMEKDYGVDGNSSGGTSSSGAPSSGTSSSGAPSSGTSSSGASSSDTSAASMRTFPASKGSGCRLLEGQEAARILGVAVDRAETETSDSEGDLCKYWVSAAERRRLIGEEMASSIAGLGKTDTKNGQQDEVEKLLGGGAGALIEASGENKDGDYAFSLQVWRKNGKEQWAKMETVQTKTRDVSGVAGADAAAVAMQAVEGVGDRATVLAAGHSIMVLKGDAFFLLGFQQFVPGRDKTVALARVVAGRM